MSLHHLEYEMHKNNKMNIFFFSHKDYIFTFSLSLSLFTRTGILFMIIAVIVQWPITYNVIITMSTATGIMLNNGWLLSSSCCYYLQIAPPQLPFCQRAYICPWVTCRTVCFINRRQFSLSCRNCGTRLAKLGTQSPFLHIPVSSSNVFEEVKLQNIFTHDQTPNHHVVRTCKLWNLWKLWKVFF